MVTAVVENQDQSKLHADHNFFFQSFMYTVAVNKKLTLCFHFYDRGTVVRRAVKR